MLANSKNPPDLRTKDTVELDPPGETAPAKKERIPLVPSTSLEQEDPLPSSNNSAPEDILDNIAQSLGQIKQEKRP